MGKKINQQLKLLRESLRKKDRNPMFYCHSISHFCASEDFTASLSQASHTLIGKVIMTLYRRQVYEQEEKMTEHRSAEEKGPAPQCHSTVARTGCHAGDSCQCVRRP